MDWPPPSDWPLAAHSQRIDLSPHRWHVQRLGKADGPHWLLLHGAGGATHSWRGLAPLLAENCQLTILDLPGHGFTRSGSVARLGLEAMTQDLARLIAAQGWRLDVVLGHSAGAAVGLRLAQQALAAGQGAPVCLGLNPALAPFDGVAGWLFPLMARTLALNPLVPALFAMSAKEDTARRLIEGTGSRLDPEGYRLYARLLRDRAHVNGALQMMARWDLKPLLYNLPALDTPVRFVTGGQDRAVAPKVAEDAAARMPDARVACLPDLGHLAHEEAPERVAAELLGGFDAARTGGIVS